MRWFLAAAVALLKLGSKTEFLPPHFYPIAIRQAGWSPLGNNKLHRAEGINPPKRRQSKKRLMGPCLLPCLLRSLIKDVGKNLARLPMRE
jgi:hypothetical protein